MRRLRSSKRRALAAGGVAALVVSLGGGVLTTSAVTGSDSAVAVGTERDGRTTKPCPELRPSGGVPTGGCQVHLERRPMRINLIGLFGEQEVAWCHVEMYLEIGPRGSVTVNDVQILGIVEGGDFGLSACADFNTCRRGVRPSEYPPPPVFWAGRLSDASRRQAKLEIEVCLTSCLGRFEGTTAFELVRRPAADWRVQAQATPVGRSGMELTADWPAVSLFGGELTIAAAAAR